MIPKIVTPQLRDFICKGFLIIKNSDYNYRQKSDMLGSLISLGAGAGWRPKEITIGALKSFVDNLYKLPKGLERAHIHHRRDTIKELIETDWKHDEWWDWLKERDFTVLATRAENRDEKNFENIKKFAIPLELNLFWGKRVGFEYGDQEKAFIKSLVEKQGLI
jgi:hypothetical protein